MEKILLIVLFSFTIFAQQPEKILLLKIKGGTVFSSLGAINAEIVFPYPGYYAGIGIEYEGLLNFDNANIGTSLEISYGRTSTGKYSVYVRNIFLEESEFIISSLPIYFWTILKTKGEIVPYIKAGLGVEKSTLEETHDRFSYKNFRFEEWFFSWGLGGGIDFNYFRDIRLSVFIDVVFKEKGIKRTWWAPTDDHGIGENRIDYNYRNSIIFSGLQFAYIF
jgi:hypothetical protein